MRLRNIAFDSSGITLAACTLRADAFVRVYSRSRGSVIRNRSGLLDMCSGWGHGRFLTQEPSFPGVGLSGQFEVA